MVKLPIKHEMIVVATSVAGLLTRFIILRISTRKNPNSDNTPPNANAINDKDTLFIQDKTLTEVLNSLYFGQVHHSGIASLDKLLGRGGIGSMMWTLSLSLIALALGGVLSEFGFLRVLILSIMKRVKRPA
jgi:NhaC family Na+:H+ antiporter